MAAKWTHPKDVNWINIRYLSQSFEDRLNEFVVNHAGNDEFIDNARDFQRIIKSWDTPPGKSIKELYEMYKQKYYNQPNNQHQNNKRINHVIGFKNKSKINSLQRIPEFSQRRIIDNTITNYFPLKENKRYFLHKIAQIIHNRRCI